MQNHLALDGPMPAFWPPRPSAFWRWLLTPLHRHWLHGTYRVETVADEGLDRLRALPPEDSALICPNHSFAGDGSVFSEISRRSPRPFHIMAAWQIFTMFGGIAGFVMQRLGCFSVDREGADRRALRQAIDILTTGRFLAVFPEGENYHLNDRLTPLREGVAFMAATAQKDLAARGRVWLFPAAIRYRFEKDVTPTLEAALSRLQARLAYHPVPGAPLAQRIVAFGEALLTLKEKEVLGQPFEGPLPERIARLIERLLGGHEAKWLGKSGEGDSVSVRVKRLRAKLLDLPEEQRGEEAGRVLSQLHLVMQLYSYPGDYVTANPTQERMAETLEKFDEDLHGREAQHLAVRRARFVLGEPIDVKAVLGEGRPRQAAEKLTDLLQAAIETLMENADNRRPQPTPETP